MRIPIEIYQSDPFYYSGKDEFFIPPLTEGKIPINLTCSISGNTKMEYSFGYIYGEIFPNFLNGISEEGLLLYFSPKTVGLSFQFRVYTDIFNQFDNSKKLTTVRSVLYKDVKLNIME